MRANDTESTNETVRPRAARSALVTHAGLLLGAGIGALLDGVVLHQILQWHNLMSNRVPPMDMESMKYNVLCDGIFHAAALLVTVLGVQKLWQSRSPGPIAPSFARFGGALLVGWGGFNFVEGMIAHQLLQLHHVRPGPHELYWDLAFLAVSLLVVIVGSSFIQRDVQRTRQLHLARGYGR
jgi:uncharacterized membrane protein